VEKAQYNLESAKQDLEKAKLSFIFIVSLNSKFRA